MSKNFFFSLVLSFLISVTQAQVFNQDLQYLIGKAFEQSSEIKMNAYKMDQSETDRRIVLNNYLPRFSVNSTYTRLNDDIVFPQNLQSLLLGTEKLLIKEHLGIPFNTSLPSSVPLAPVDPIQKKNIFKVTGNAQMLLFSGLKIPMAIQAAKHQQKAIRLLNEAEKNKLMIEVTDVYNKMALVLSSEAVLNASGKLLSEQSFFVEQAIKNGLVTPVERQKIELAKQRLEVKRIEFTGNKSLLVDKLHQLTGLSDTELMKLAPSLRPMVLATDSSSVTVISRKEIQSINEVIEALTYKQKIEKSEYIPKLAMFGQYEFRKQNLSLLEPQWYAGLRLQWSIFDGFTAKENIHKIEMDKKIYEEKKKEINDMQALGISKAELEYSIANQKIKMMKAGVSLAEKIYDLTNKQYKNGLTTQTELLNSINEVEKANLDLLNVYYEQCNAGIRLLDAKGVLAIN